MNKNSLLKYSILSFMLLLILTTFTNVGVKVNGIIYIKADGSIEGTDKIEQNGNTYKFTDNIEMKEYIKIEKDDIIVDGAGYSLKVTNTNFDDFAGIKISNQKNVTIKRLSVDGFNYRNEAIYINKAQNIIIKNCTLTKTNIGINVDHSQNIKITQNKITNFERTSISMYNCTNSSITENYISGNRDFRDTHGLNVLYSENLLISQNNISDCHYGIEIHGCYETTFSRNYIAKNDKGVYLYYGGNNIVTDNTIINNELFGMELSSSSNNPANIIYHNNFINNNMEYISEQLQVSNRWFAGPESNTWDNGKEGNYWSDYTLRYPNVTRKETPEIWLIDFFINPENIDRYPLVNPWIPDTTPPIISIMSPQNKSYTTANILINCSINEAVEEIKYSIDGQAKITFAENFTLTELSEGEHNLIIYATDIFGNVGSSATLFFTVDVPEPLPTNLIIASVAIIVVGLGILAYFKKYKK